MPQSFWDSLIPKYRPAPGQKELPPVPSGPMPDRDVYPLPKTPSIAENPTVARLAAFADTYTPKLPKSVDDVLLDALTMSPGGAAVAGAAAKGVSTAIGLIPPKYIKGLADALTRRIDLTPNFPGKQIAIKASQQFPTSSAHLSEVSGKDINFAGVHRISKERPRDQVSRTAIRNNPERQKFIEEIIETPDYTLLSPDARAYWEDTKNFGKIHVNPNMEWKAKTTGPWSLDELIPHEFTHAGQMTTNRIKPHWMLFPEDIKPHELGARVTARMRANPDAKMNYNDELLKELNAYIQTPGARKMHWDNLIGLFNERMKHSSRQIVPIPNELTPSGFYVGQKFGQTLKRPPTSRPYKRFEFQQRTAPDDPDRFIIIP